MYISQYYCKVNRQGMTLNAFLLPPFLRHSCRATKSTLHAPCFAKLSSNMFSFSSMPSGITSDCRTWTNDCFPGIVKLRWDRFSEKFIVPPYNQQACRTNHKICYLQRARRANHKSCYQSASTAVRLCAAPDHTTWAIVVLTRDRE